MLFLRSAIHIISYLAFSRNHLVNLSLKRQEGRLSKDGVLVVETGKRTGRSPKDRFFVRDALTEYNIAWDSTNKPFNPEDFDYWNQKAENHLEGSTIKLVDTFQVGNEEFGVNVKVTTEYAWHMLFAHNLFTKVTDKNPGWELLNLPNMVTTAGLHGANSDGLVVINFACQRILILGMRYAGEMKKAMFTVLNYLLPMRDVLPMHCSANLGDNGNTTLFFGLSGTGKTSLSMDPSRKLIGDDEHGWSSNLIFNFEGGCYAKVINLDPKAEPIIYDSLLPGAIMENVVIDKEGQANFYDSSLTENTRLAYPRSFIKNSVLSNSGPVPKDVVFLTCDMYGVLPPISKLTASQTLFYFLSGYTAKVGSTELGASEGIEPTFSTCFGAPFFPRTPMVYGKLLLQRVQEANANVYLVNTGWQRGTNGKGGNRYAISVTREVVKCITNGQFQCCQWDTIPGFDLAIPKDVSLPCAVDPRSEWIDETSYSQAANKLIEKLNFNFDQYDPNRRQDGRPSTYVSEMIH